MSQIPNNFDVAVIATQHDTYRHALEKSLRKAGLREPQVMDTADLGVLNVSWKAPHFGGKQALEKALRATRATGARPLYEKPRGLLGIF